MRPYLISQVQSVRLPALHEAVTACTTPADVTAEVKAVSLVPGHTADMLATQFAFNGDSKNNNSMSCHVFIAIGYSFAPARLNYDNRHIQCRCYFSEKRPLISSV